MFTFGGGIVFYYVHTCTLFIWLFCLQAEIDSNYIHRTAIAQLKNMRIKTVQQLVKYGSFGLPRYLFNLPDHYMLTF